MNQSYKLDMFVQHKVTQVNGQMSQLLFKMICKNILLPIADWANKNYKLFSQNGFERQYGILQNLNPPSEVWLIKKQIIDRYNLIHAKQEPCFKDYCGYITKGGAIHPHTDKNEGNLIHTRFNVMVSKPFEGGEPIQNGVVIDVEEGDIWRCDAGLVKHWCNQVVGDKPRIVLSFGFLL